MPKLIAHVAPSPWQTLRDLVHADHPLGRHLEHIQLLEIEDRHPAPPVGATAAATAPTVPGLTRIHFPAQISACDVDSHSPRPSGTGTGT